MATKGENEQSFETNFKKLEALAQQLQNNEISVDQLIPRMKEALSAIRICKEVLQETKVQLNEIGSEFEQLTDKAE